MPTFLFFKKGSKIDEVVGADIMAVERKIGQYSSSSGGSAGYVLGSGQKTASGDFAVLNDRWLTRLFLFALVIWVLYAIFVPNE